jgi:sulfur-carrier protein adenylyltransferase/sulfurtransferase
MREITPTELRDMLAGQEPPLLVDVREPVEADIAQIAGSLLIPMGSLPQRLQEIPKDRPVALYCHAGMRSAYAAEWLTRQGYDALSLAGGIDRWAMELEPAMRRY